MVNEPTKTILDYATPMPRKKGTRWSLLFLLLLLVIVALFLAILLD